MNLNDVVDLQGAAELTGLTTTTISNYAHRGTDGFPRPVDKIGGYRLWSKKELEQWVRNRKK